MSRKNRGSSVNGTGLEMSGVSDLLKKIERAGGSVDDAVKEAADASLELIGLHMQLFMMSHRRTGETKGSYEQVPAVISGGKVTARVGYNTKKGGTPAIFLDVGTPRQKPNFFRYYAIQNNAAELQRIQQETLQKILKGLI